MKTNAPFFTVVVTGPSLAREALDLLSPTCLVEFTEAYAKPSDLVQKLERTKADALIVRTGKITREIIKASPHLKVIAKHGIGVDNIDVDAASAAKIPVLVAASANYESVAEHALGLMLALVKDIPRLDQRVREGHWDKTSYRGVELFKKTLGLVGFGRIGRRVQELVAPLQMKVLVYDPLIDSDRIPPGALRVGKMEDLLSSADIVSLHCPLTPQTRHLIGQRELAMMKKSAWLINTARGEVVDEEALVAALQAGIIAGAGLDTLRKEPPEDFNALANAGRVVLTPHVASGTEEAYLRMGLEAAKNVLTVLEGKQPDRACQVNPEI
jgi:D-3-phosphoglycerate dehydrogenase